MLQHFHWHSGDIIPHRPGKVVCVGRNYVAHAAELGNEVPEEPLLFIKPATALTALEPGFIIPVDRGEVHHETELALLVGQPLTRANTEQAAAAILGIGIALDLTLRDLQNQLKALRQPWEKAKAFDDSCPVSRWVPITAFPSWDDIAFSLQVNGEPRQSGHSSLMIWSMLELTTAISQHFTLLPGDLILTGTPAGVGPLHLGDQLTLELAQQLRIHCQVSR
jgi:2-keto-4-pentenoate hydratase/2-oxohepta-3-ene-1,7-dioic acid hydratase in catechol pathway